MLVDCFLSLWFRGLINLRGILWGKSYTKPCACGIQIGGAKERQQGRLRITRFVLMPISLWIKLNHASCSLYLSLYICSGLNVWRSAYIHRPFKSSMVFGLKCLLRSNWHGVKFDWWTSELILIHIGCICGLTPAEISKSNWMSQWAEFKWEGK